ncbi:cytochrome P450 [Paracoccus tibetensis]|uniref:Cytochrome P450 n=1 Tax=Paracoccus tibetensis TaxID=336292 RepID=A0A1G5JZL7_9RHOB|nr:cytochrome P450 [Paracoccus tibetensis]SCY93843.1 Cytochrome P450 [Paracoccus tibetensis]
MDGEASSGPGAFKPPKIEMAQWPLSTWSLLRVMVRNPVATVPPAAYREAHASLQVGRQAMFYPSDPALVEEILVRKHEDFAKSRIDNSLLNPILGNGILTAEGDVWRRQRRLAAPAFRAATLSSHLPVMRSPFEELVERWALNPGPHRIDNAMTAATIAVICRAFFSNFDQGDADRVSGAIARYLRPSSWPITYEALGLPKWTPHPGKLTMEQAAAEARQLVWSFVARRRQGRKVPPDLAQVLMDARDPETGRALSDEELVNTFLTLIAAGHETSANALTWALYCLAAQPELQDALADHVRNVIGDGPVEAPHLEALPDVTQFIEETMRLLPPVPILSRRPLHPCQIGGHSIEQTTLVFIPIYAIHRHEALWSSPESFDPERFAGGYQTPRQRCAFMPFGAGPRICLGASFAMIEMVAGLGTMLAALRFRLHDKTPPEPMHRITLRPRKEVVLGLELRS